MGPCQPESHRQGPVVEMQWPLTQRPGTSHDAEQQSAPVHPRRQLQIPVMPSHSPLPVPSPLASQQPPQVRKTARLRLRTGQNRLPQRSRPIGTDSRRRGQPCGVGAQRMPRTIAQAAIVDQRWEGKMVWRLFRWRVGGVSAKSCHAPSPSARRDRIDRRRVQCVCKPGKLKPQTPTGPRATNRPP